MKTLQGTLAKTVAVLMVRGLFHNFEFPYTSFPTSSLTGEQMVPIFLEAIMRIESWFESNYHHARW